MFSYLFYGFILRFRCMLILIVAAGKKGSFPRVCFLQSLFPVTGHAWFATNRSCLTVDLQILTKVSIKLYYFGHFNNLLSINNNNILIWFYQYPYLSLLVSLCLKFPVTFFCSPTSFIMSNVRNYVMIWIITLPFI